MEITRYDYSEEYENEILPHVNEIRKACAAHKIPCVFLCAPKSDDNMTYYKTESILTGHDGKYNFLKEYEKEILPHVNEIRKFCALHKLPFIFSCEPETDGYTKTFKTDGVLPGSLGVRLKDDRFGMCLLAINGGVFVPPEVINERNNMDIQNYINAEIDI